MKQKLKWDELAGIFLAAAGIGMLGVSVYLCFSGDIWYDELFTMGLANQSLGELISITAADVHPPLYYMIVKLFLMMGTALFGSVNQVVVAKLVSTLPFLLCMIYAIVKVRKHFGMLPAGLFCFLLPAMPKLADYTVEVRMYGFALFFILAGMLHAYEITLDFQKKSYVNWIALTFYALAACYTHYFACVASCMIYAYVLMTALIDRKGKQITKPFLTSGLICVVGYLPWLSTAVVSQVGTVKDNYWIQPLSLRTLGGCVKFLFMPALGNDVLNIAAAALLFGIYAFLLVLFIRKQRHDGKKKSFFVFGSLGCLAGIVLFGFVASALVRPIFVYRYMLPAMGLFWLTFALLVAGLKDRKVLVIPLLFLLVLTGMRNYRSFYGEEMWKRVQMQKTQEALSGIEKDALLICNFNQVQAVVSSYLPNESLLWYGEPEELIVRMYPQNHSLVEGEFTDEAGIERLRELLMTGQPVWFLGSGNAREEILAKWEKEGISAQETDSVLLERYWFNLYRIKSNFNN